jgi:VWFA-related protein
MSRLSLPDSLTRLVLHPLVLLAIVALATASVVRAQDQTQNPAPSQTQSQQPSQTPAEAGGPSGDNGVIALPKKKEEPAPPPAPAAPSIKNPPGMGNVTLHIDVPEVTVDVGVLLEKTHQFVPGLKPSNFRVYEDGVQQNIIGFRRVEAPVTALLLCEFARNSYYFINDMRNAAWEFTEQLRPQDYVALMTFDLRTQILVDFTQNKTLLQRAIYSLQLPDFDETDVFDALYEAIDRLDRVEGQKYIILIASGRDSISRVNYDKILKKIKDTRDITIFTISTGGMLRQLTEGRGGLNGQLRDMSYMQADNEMRTFANLTGGMSFQPIFITEMPDIFADINNSIRAKYELVYRPSNPKQDGSYRKLRVTLVDDEGNPLRMQDEKHKQLKYDIVARDGYRAKQEVE